MPKITIDGRVIESRDHVPVLQAALEAGWDVPHYCYHPGLSIVASCRLCLMEIQMPDPKTRELSWSSRLVPSCQTPVKDGLVVRFNSDLVRKNQRSCMEFFLLNHPLDCPVCDQAGECYLQDYSYKFGKAESRMVDQKLKNPKKDIGPHTLLYQDRCVMCTRCVRFTDEISGTHELCVVNRGSRAEIDVFPGLPLDNSLQGNVVDLCPVGSLLDKDFLFKRRVWELREASSVCPGCATGCTVGVHHAENVVYRLKPRFNPKVNSWWICDEGRFGWKYVQDRNRIIRPWVQRGLERTFPVWQDVPEILRFRISEQVTQAGSEKVVVVVSPFMACEEAWLLLQFMRQIAPQATLVLGPVPLKGDDRLFPIGASNGNAKFTILKEKCPNRRGIELLLSHFGGPVQSVEEFLNSVPNSAFQAGWIVGGYPEPWVDSKFAAMAEKIPFLIVQDLLESPLTAAAAIVLPFGAWVERDGSFMNCAGLVQPFERVVHPPEGSMRDGQYLFEIAGYRGLYSGVRVRQMMAESLPVFGDVWEPPNVPEHSH